MVFCPLRDLVHRSKKFLNVIIPSKMGFSDPKAPPGPPAATFHQQPLFSLLCFSTFFTLLLRFVGLSERESEEEKAGEMLSDNPEGSSGFLRKDRNSVENC